VNHTLLDLSPVLEFTKDTNRPVSMLSEHTAWQRFSNSPPAIVMRLKTAI
jgi:hypothetical protein